MESGRLRAKYCATYETEFRDDPAPRRPILPRKSFLTTTSLIATRGCHNRCGFCYLSTEGLRMPYRVRDPEQVVAEFAADGQPYAVTDEPPAPARALKEPAKEQPAEQEAPSGRPRRAPRE